MPVFESLPAAMEPMVIALMAPLAAIARMRGHHARYAPQPA